MWMTNNGFRDFVAGLRNFARSQHASKVSSEPVVGTVAVLLAAGSHRVSVTGLVGKWDPARELFRKWSKSVASADGCSTDCEEVICNMSQLQAACQLLAVNVCGPAAS